MDDSVLELDSGGPEVFTASWWIFRPQLARCLPELEDLDGQIWPAFRDEAHVEAKRVQVAAALLGDAVHNLRSALDSLAYDLAVRHLGTLLPTQEKATKFPICKDDAVFRLLMTEKVTKEAWRSRDQLHGPDGIEALRAVQPFALADEAAAMEVQQGRTAEQHFQSDAVNRLNLLWNLDKHRRLPAVAWFYQDIYWGDHSVPWRPARPNRSLLSDHELIGHFDFTTPESMEPFKPTVRIDLAFIDDPSAFPQPAIGLLERVAPASEWVDHSSGVSYSNERWQGTDVDLLASGRVARMSATGTNSVP